MIYITGDTHRDFGRIFDFCNRIGTTKDDTIIILGDAGINFLGDSKDKELKERLSELPITLFCIHGNHEMRPRSVGTYRLGEAFKGTVYVEPKYPNIQFAVDGELYEINGYKTVVCGGAYSVDKPFRLANGYGWWPDEQPDDVTKRRVVELLKKMDWKADCVLTHIAPLKYEPVENFIPGLDQSSVDKSTEFWLDGIEDKLDYKRWYAGHYHCDKWKSDKFRLMFNDIDEFMG